MSKPLSPPSRRSVLAGRRLTALAWVAWALSPTACGIFDDDLSTESATSGAASASSAGSTSSDPGSTSEGDPTAALPTQAVQVYPRYRLQDIDAVVTLQDGAADPIPCIAMAATPGYLCDADDVTASEVAIAVERDGFDARTVVVDIVPNGVAEVTVHLAPEGGAIGTWSACVPDADFETCDAVCDSVQTTCAPASCGSDDPVEPYATLARFDSPDCMGTPTTVAAERCSAPAQLDGASWLQCCCDP